MQVSGWVHGVQVRGFSLIYRNISTQNEGIAGPSSRSTKIHIEYCLLYAIMQATWVFLLALLILRFFVPLSGLARRLERDWGNMRQKERGLIVQVTKLKSLMARYA